MSIETNKTAGDDVDSRCLKCKAVTNHTIIAMSEETIAKVQCNTCGARHNYRAPVATKKKSSATVRRQRDTGKVTESSPRSSKAKVKVSPKKRVSRGAVNFDALIIDKDISTAIPYDLDAHLAVDDLIKHPTFGLGVVMEIIRPNKVQVAFREHGAKLLLCSQV